MHTVMWEEWRADLEGQSEDTQYRNKMSTYEENHIHYRQRGRNRLTLLGIVLEQARWKSLLTEKGI